MDFGRDAGAAGETGSAALNLPLLRTILDNLPVGLIATSLGPSRLYYMNDRFAEICGWPRAAVSDFESFGRAVFPDPEQRRHWMDIIVHSWTQTEPSVRRWPDVPLVGADGRTRRVLVTQFVMPEQDISIAVIEDTTELFEAIKALKASEARLALALESGGAGLWDLDLVGNRFYCSPNAFRSFGYEADELNTSLEALLALIHPDDIERARFTGQAEHGNPVDERVAEYRVRAKDGSYRWLQIRGRVVARAPDGRMQRIVGTGTDITESKNAELERERLSDQLRQAQRLESVGRLAGGIAHDFNNVLVGIMGNASLALMQLKPDHPAHGFIKGAIHASESAASLVRQLLAFSRKQMIEPVILDLNKSIQDMRKMLERVIGEDIELVANCQPGLAPVRADPSQIEQIVINLAVNARDAMPNGGVLTIETADVLLGDDFCANHPEVAPGEYVMLAVRDNGCGMSPEAMEHLFEPFYTTKPKDKGTGLGLASVWGAVKQHNGSVTVRSDVGRGTVFKIYLPRADSAPAADVSARTDHMPRGSETILLVEDAAVVRELVATILARLGYRVVCAASGPAALEIAAAFPEPLHLLLTDVVMPRMNGRELAERLMQTRPSLKVLYSSGHTENVISDHGVLGSGINFVGKPYTPALLARKVREVLDSDASAAGTPESASHSH